MVRQAGGYSQCGLIPAFFFLVKIKLDRLAVNE